MKCLFSSGKGAGDCIGDAARGRSAAVATKLADMLPAAVADEGPEWPCVSAALAARFAGHAGDACRFRDAAQYLADMPFGVLGTFGEGCNGALPLRYLRIPRNVPLTELDETHDPGAAELGQASVIIESGMRMPIESRGPSQC